MAGDRLIPPKNGATVRMYRTGHGDCFLLAFASETEDKPVYVLIDCGYKPGSPAYIHTTIEEIATSIKDATGGHLDVAVITHEHQDHVNGITEANFQGITIGETWFAWTEDPNDEMANDLRKKFKDQILGLLAARNRLAVEGAHDQVSKIDDFLAFELGGDEEKFDAASAAKLLGAAGDPAKSKNKQSMKLFKDRAANGVKYIRPHEELLTIPGAKDLRIFAMGPPRDLDLLSSLMPEGDEEFHPAALATTSLGAYFAAAAAAADPDAPFANRYRIAKEKALAHPDYGQFFTTCYGQQDTPPSLAPNDNEVPANPEWRRIDKDWLFSAEQLALDMNDQTNNASLVLAFELGKNGKVLLFAGDAQRGNWMSWSKKDWQDGDQKVTAKDLLSRTVLYKVGHHGSHNATLNGTLQDDHPSLGWMADGTPAQEFTAMITAVRAWAETQKGWDHPLKAIKDALLLKSSGRVFQTDKDFNLMEMFDPDSEAGWTAFQARTHGDRLYFDYTVTA